VCAGGAQLVDHVQAFGVVGQFIAEMEMTALCLRILQASLVYVNTLMLQDVLVEPAWAKLLTPVDRRALTPLFWEHVRPYGEVRLDLGSRLSIGVDAGR
jgi:Tn3 transposase DDE domain